MGVNFKQWLAESGMNKVPTQSGAEVWYDDPETKRIAKKMLGRFSPDDLADLVGAFEGCIVTVGPLGPRELMFVVNGPQSSFRANRRLIQSWEDNSLYLSNDDLHAPQWARGQKIGARLLSKQAEAARRLGVQVIKTYAQRGGDNYGYYSMPRMGYDADLPDDMRAQLPSGFKNAKTIQDLMSIPQGREWWKQNGKAMYMRFDPSEKSRSSTSLGTYLR